MEQAQHFFMRKRTEYVLDTIAKEIADPLIISHWNVLNSPTQSCVKINIMTHGYDTVCRTSLVVHIGQRSFKCVCRDGRVMLMSYEPQELRDLIYCQVWFYILLLNPPSIFCLDLPTPNCSSTGCSQMHGLDNPSQQSSSRSWRS